MSSSVIKGLQNSSKGQLKYNTEWNPESLFSEKSLPPIHCTKPVPVFDLKSMRVALDFIEDDALTAEKNRLLEERDRRKNANTGSQSSHVENHGALELFSDEFQKTSQRLAQQIADEKRRADMNRMRARNEIYKHFNEEKQELRLKTNQRKRERLAREKNDVENYLKQCAESARKIEMDSQEHQARLLKTRMQEMEERRIKLQQLEKEREELRRERFSFGLIQFKELELIYSKITDEFEAFQHKESLASSKVPRLLEEGQKRLSQSNEVLASSMPQKFMTAENLETIQSSLKSMTDLYSAFSSEITSVQAQISLRLQKQQEEKLKQEEQQKIAAEAELAEKLKTAQESNPEFNAPALPEQFRFCVSSSAYDRYKTLRDKMKQFDEQGKELTKSGDKTMKKLALDLSRAVSVPIASITDRSGSDVKGKLGVLSGVLKGQYVKVGTKSVSTGSSPQALKYATNLIARKIVQQADEQVSANFTSAFSIALVIVGVWAESPDFGELFLAHLYSKCAYAVPFYIPKEEKQTDEEHQRALGYIVAEDGSVEGQDKYLKRMSGLVRLYAAVIQSPLPPGVTKHPHDLANGWIWLTRILNLDPYPDISATVLYDFLDVAGHALMKTYGRQFEKLLYAICHDYYPRIEEISSLGQRAPMIRLKNFLEKCIKQKSVPTPEGHLDKNFWSTYHSGDVVGE